MASWNIRTWTPANANPDNELEQEATPENSGMSPSMSESSGAGGTDADLAALIARWPDLPEAIRRAILAIVDAMEGLAK